MLTMYNIIQFMSGKPKAQGHRAYTGPSAAGTRGRYAQARSFVNLHIHPCSLQVYTSYYTNTKGPSRSLGTVPSKPLEMSGWILDIDDAGVSGAAAAPNVLEINPKKVPVFFLGFESGSVA